MLRLSSKLQRMRLVSLKTKRPSKPNDKIKGKKFAEKLKKEFKDGLVKTPAPRHLGVSRVKKDEKSTSSDKKEKKKLKKLEKKPKEKKAIKKEKTETPENGEKAKKDKDASKKPEQNGKKKVRPLVTLKERRRLQRLEDAKNRPKMKGTAEQTVFVGNLPTNTKRIQIIKHFRPYGTIVAIRLRTASGKILYRHNMRKQTSTLNAYVIFSDVQSATKALEANGKEFKGNHLRVTPAERIDVIIDPKRTIFVGNLKLSCADEKLRGIFSSCGEIDYVRTLHSQEKEGCNGSAFVCFQNTDAVGLALELKGTMLDDRPIRVERFERRKSGATTRLHAIREKNEYKFPKGSMKVDKSPKKDGKREKAKPTSDGDEGKKKKSEFRGVKADDSKKKRKKKSSDEMKKLAKKIAPRSDE